MYDKKTILMTNGMADGIVNLTWLMIEMKLIFTKFSKREKSFCTSSKLFKAHDEPFSSQFTITRRLCSHGCTMYHRVEVSAAESAA